MEGRNIFLRVDCMDRPDAEDLIVSPSHEAILPDVPPQNVKALAQAACMD